MYDGRAEVDGRADSDHGADGREGTDADVPARRTRSDWVLVREARRAGSGISGSLMAAACLMISSLINYL